MENKANHKTVQAIPCKGKSFCGHAGWKDCDTGCPYYKPDPQAERDRVDELMRQAAEMTGLG